MKKMSLKMNNKGQVMSILFSLLVFLILWGMFFAKWIADWGQTFIEDQALDGLSAFLVANMNIWVFAGVIIGVVTTIYVGGRS